MARRLTHKETPLPDVCLQDGRFIVDMDTECYFIFANRTIDALKRDQYEPFCWGYANINSTELEPGTAGHPLLFHTAALTGLPPTTPLLLNSFLATQCCDAVLWFWLPAALHSHPSVRNATLALPAHQRHRVVWRVLDLEQEWSSVASDFPRANASSVAAVSSWEDLRFITDWARLLIMYVHGGTWFDIDTVFLHDARPLIAIQAPSFAYRAGWGILINNAVMRIARRPEPLARYILDEVLWRQDPRPDEIGYIVIHHYINFGRHEGTARFGHGYPKRGFTYASESLIDFLWYRFLNAETPPMKKVHPEIGRGAHALSPSRAWTGFFATTYNASTTPSLDDIRAMPFLPGSIVYHWHNRYAFGLPPGSWASVLNERYERMAAAKPCASSATRTT